MDRLQATLDAVDAALGDAPAPSLQDRLRALGVTGREMAAVIEAIREQSAAIVQRGETVAAAIEAKKLELRALECIERIEP